MHLAAALTTAALLPLLFIELRRLGPLSMMGSASTALVSWLCSAGSAELQCCSREQWRCSSCCSPLCVPTSNPPRC